MLAATMISGSLLSPFSALAQDGEAVTPLNDNTATATTAGVEGAAPNGGNAANDSGDLFEQSWLQAQGSPIDFGDPWILLGLPPALLALWFALRAIPVRPRDVEFAPLFILEQLETLESEPNEMKVLEKMIWMGALTGAFLAAAEPNMNPQPSFEQPGPIVIAADTGFASAPNFNKHRESMRELIRHAYNDDRDIVFLKMADSENGTPVGTTEPMNPALALSYVEDLSAVPWVSDRAAATEAVKALNGASYGATYWMSNGLQDDATLDFTVSLNNLAPLTVYDESNKPHLFMPPTYRNGEYQLTIKRADLGAAENVRISAYDEGHNLLGSETVTFSENDGQAGTIFTPSAHNVSNDQIFRFSVDGEKSAGATVLVNENYKPRSVGIASRDRQAGTDSLLSEARFLQAALDPYTDIYFGSIEELIDSDDVSVLIIPDSVPVNSIARSKIENWTENGGMTVRFAGPNLAREAHVNDPLLPVDLRQGSRALADSIAAAGEGLKVQDFDEDTPFAHIDPDETVSVSKQVIMNPSPDLEDKIWARLSDGTPLVTADARGSGRVVLFHTTANTLWSELPLSNNFVDMLVATIGQSNSVENTSDYELPEMQPLSVLNGRGELRAPSAIVEPLTQSVMDRGGLGPRHPPGMYGTPLMGVPYNVSDTVEYVEPLGALPENIKRTSYKDVMADDGIKGWLWSGALALVLMGSLVLAGQRGGLFGRGGNRKQKPDVSENKGNTQDAQNRSQTPRL